MFRLLTTVAILLLIFSATPAQGGTAESGGNVPPPLSEPLVPPAQAEATPYVPQEPIPAPAMLLPEEGEQVDAPQSDGTGAAVAKRKPPTPWMPRKSKKKTPSEFRIGVGTKACFLVGIPFPAVFALHGQLDFAKWWRFKFELNFIAIDQFYVRTGVSFGLAFPIYGRKGGRFQFKIPLLLSAGLIAGEIDDFYETSHSAFPVIGPTTGFDFTWWSRRRKVGFWFWIGAGFMFWPPSAADPDAIYSNLNYHPGTPEASLIWGASF